MELVVEVTNTDAGLRGKVRMPGQQPAVFAGWLQFLAIIETAANLDVGPPGGQAIGSPSGARTPGHS